MGSLFKSAAVVDFPAPLCFSRSFKMASATYSLLAVNLLIKIIQWFSDLIRCTLFHSGLEFGNSSYIAFMSYYFSKGSLQCSAAGFFRFLLAVFCSFWWCSWFLPLPYILLVYKINEFFFLGTHDLLHLSESNPVVSLHAYLIYSSRASKLTVFRSWCERTLKLHLQRNVHLLFISCAGTSPNDFRLSISF